MKWIKSNTILYSIFNNINDENKRILQQQNEENSSQRARVYMGIIIKYTMDNVQ